MLHLPPKYKCDKCQQNFHHSQALVYHKTKKQCWDPTPNVGTGQVASPGQKGKGDSS